MSESRMEKLENVIKQMLTPLKGIPLDLVIESISGKKIIPFNKNDKKDEQLLQKLIKVAKNTGKEINRKGIKRSRPNEVGNDIEAFVKDALNEIGYNAETPLTTRGVRKSTGYPDIEFVDEFNRTNYLECKTFNIENIATTQRSFYLSPSEDFKITEDAHHFVISYEIYIKASDGSKNIYNCKSWKILSLNELDIDVKYEFNSDNKRMYSSELIIAEGKI